jgi:hypothetical protein
VRTSQPLTATSIHSYSATINRTQVNEHHFQSPIPLIGYCEDASISCLAFASRRRLDGMFTNYRDLFRELD